METTPGEDHTAGYQLGMDHTAGRHLEMGHSDGHHPEAEMGHAIGDGPHHRTTTGDDHTTGHQMGMDHTAGPHLKRTTWPDDTWRWVMQMDIPRHSTGRKSESEMGHTTGVPLKIHHTSGLPLETCHTTGVPLETGHATRLHLVLLLDCVSLIFDITICTLGL
nr:hypothetical protein BaRGS_006130 [Batillaria attramentaria]